MCCTVDFEVLQRRDPFPLFSLGSEFEELRFLHPWINQRVITALSSVGRLAHGPSTRLTTWESPYRFPYPPDPDHVPCVIPIMQLVSVSHL